MFEEWLRLNTSLSAFSIKHYTYWVKYILSKTKDSVSIKNVEKSLLDCKNIFKPNTLKVIFAAFKQYSLYRNINYKIPHNLLQTEICTVAIEENELAKIHSDYIHPNSFINNRNQILFQFLFKTGLRAREVINLKWSDITNNVLNVRGKGEKFRKIPIGESLLVELSKLKSTKYIFETNKGGKLTYSALHFAINDAKRKVLINNKITPHSFRRGFATTLYRKGMPINMISRLLGHASIATTEVYLKYDVYDIAKWLQNINF